MCVFVRVRVDTHTHRHSDTFSYEYVRAHISMCIYLYEMVVLKSVSISPSVHIHALLTRTHAHGRIHACIHPCLLQIGRNVLDQAENDEVKAVFARHSKLLAAQAGTAELDSVTPLHSRSPSPAYCCLEDVAQEKVQYFKPIPRIPAILSMGAVPATLTPGPVTKAKKDAFVVGTQPALEPHYLPFNWVSMPFNFGNGEFEGLGLEGFRLRDGIHYSGSGGIVVIPSYMGNIPNFAHMEDPSRLQIPPETLGASDLPEGEIRDVVMDVSRVLSKRSDDCWGCGFIPPCIPNPLCLIACLIDLMLSCSGCMTESTILSLFCLWAPWGFAKALDDVLKKHSEKFQSRGWSVRAEWHP